MEVTLKREQKNRGYETVGKMIFSGYLMPMPTKECAHVKLMTGLYKVDIVADGITHREQMAIVCCDDEQEPAHVLALICSGNDCQGNSVIVSPEAYGAIFLLVKACTNRNETVSLSIEDPIL